MKKVAAPRVPVKELLSEDGAPMGLRLVGGRAGLKNLLDRSRVQRPGLALTGFTRYLSPGRVQILGGSESSYLRTLTVKRRPGNAKLDRWYSTSRCGSNPAFATFFGSVSR